MRYLALAVDYDGTIAHNGKVDDSTYAALKRLRDSGRRLLLVTGRILSELQATFPKYEIFERIVAENGALIYDPATKEEKVIAESPPAEFAERLIRCGCTGVQSGRVIVATWEPHEKKVLETIRDMGLEMQVIFNKGAVMVLPSGVNKATGLTAALAGLGLSPHNCVAVGDAENDHAFLALSECSVAVSNALPSVKERADLAMKADHGAGVAELIERLLADDLADCEHVLSRHRILLGTTDRGEEISLDPHGRNIMVAGSSGSGKSTLTTGILERLQTAGYQYVIIDPEGDYSTLEHAVMLGDPKRPPLVEEVMDLLKSPGPPVVVNLLGVALEHRPAFFDSLFPRLQAQRTQTGRPHWIIVDEAHHLMHATYAPADESLPKKLEGMLFITVHPESVVRSVVESIDVLIAVGESPGKTVANFCETTGRQVPEVEDTPLPSGDAIVWRPKEQGTPIRVKTTPPKTERRRHSRKYAEGNLGPDNSFYFRGPVNKLKLKAQNLSVFLQMADGVDDETWSFHLDAGDYSEWLRTKIKDEALAEEVVEIERNPGEPSQSRKAVRAAIETRYTLTADAPSGMVGGDGSNGENR